MKQALPLLRQQNGDVDVAGEDLVPLVALDDLLPAVEDIEEEP